VDGVISLSMAWSSCRRRGLLAVQDREGNGTESDDKLA
jgi:hypothetical protein